jgi:hypothetical protein
VPFFAGGVKFARFFKGSLHTLGREVRRVCPFLSRRRVVGYWVYWLCHRPGRVSVCSNQSGNSSSSNGCLTYPGPTTAGALHVNQPYGPHS